MSVSTVIFTHAPALALRLLFFFLLFVSDSFEQILHWTYVCLLITLLRCKNLLISHQMQPRAHPGLAPLPKERRHILHYTVLYSGREASHKYLLIYFYYL